MPTQSPRIFLFLQGMAGFFFSRLAAELQHRGGHIHRINFNGGDWLFWSHRKAANFRGQPVDWPVFLLAYLQRHAITDIVLFGDCRPAHRVAIALAQASNVRVHVCEEGYLRPDWVTLEEGGVNGYSRLSRDPSYIINAANALSSPSSSPPVPASFARRAFEDVAYNFASLIAAPLYPHEQTHRLRPRLIEYAGWSWKVLRSPWLRPATRRAIAAAGQLHFILPLQLNSDAQIRVHSPFGDMATALQHILLSFARHAPAGMRLLVKEHPLDDGLINWRRLVEREAAALGIAQNVHYAHAGDLALLARCARGMVTVNSTAGAHALAAGLPVVALGTAIYDIPGLTHQGGLDSFWHTPSPPHRELFIAFRKVLIARCLIAGNFFSELGLSMLTQNAAQRLLVNHAI